MGLGGGNGDALGDQPGQPSCAWQFGGANFTGTTSTFGGTSVTEFSSTLLPLVYPRPAGPVIRFTNFRRVLTDNPCARSGSGDG